MRDHFVSGSCMIWLACLCKALINIHVADKNQFDKKYKMKSILINVHQLKCQSQYGSEF